MELNGTYICHSFYIFIPLCDRKRVSHLYAHQTEIEIQKLDIDSINIKLNDEITLNTVEKYFYRDLT